MGFCYLVSTWPNHKLVSMYTYMYTYKWWHWYTCMIWWWWWSMLSHRTDRRDLNTERVYLRNDCRVNIHIPHDPHPLKEMYLLSSQSTHQMHSNYIWPGIMCYSYVSVSGLYSRFDHFGFSESVTGLQDKITCHMEISHWDQPRVILYHI